MGGNGTCCGMVCWCILLGRNPRCFWFLIDPWWCIIIVEETGMGSSYAEDAGGGNSGCTSSSWESGMGASSVEFRVVYQCEE